MHMYLLKRNCNSPKHAVVRSEANNGNKDVILKTCTPFTDCISEINNTQVDHAKNIDVVIPMYNLI